MSLRGRVTIINIYIIYILKNEAKSENEKQKHSNVSGCYCNSNTYNYYLFFRCDFVAVSAIFALYSV